MTYSKKNKSREAVSVPRHCLDAVQRAKSAGRQSRNFRNMIGACTCFTLIEVVVALAILGLGIVAALSLLTSARSRSVKAYDRWKEMHMMSQAIEYFMLFQTENEHVPEQFFPYDGFSVSYSFHDPTGLPDDAETTVGSWKLITMKVELRKNDSSINRTMSIDRIITDESSSTTE